MFCRGNIRRRRLTTHSTSAPNHPSTAHAIIYPAPTLSREQTQSPPNPRFPSILVPPCQGRPSLPGGRAPLLPLPYFTPPGQGTSRLYLAAIDPASQPQLTNHRAYRRQGPQLKTGWPLDCSKSREPPLNAHRSTCASLSCPPLPSTLILPASSRRSAHTLRRFVFAAAAAQHRLQASLPDPASKGPRTSSAASDRGPPSLLPSPSPSNHPPPWPTRA